jgi:glycosyltransferase involved in cell wall biosynthesis
MTAARNEKSFIEHPIRSVLSQTILPERWVIVSDGSTDGTDEIIAEYASKYDFIQFVRRDNKGDNSGFVSKVLALREAYHRLQEMGYQYIGNLDADVSFESDYYDKIISKLSANRQLGIAGGFIFEYDQGAFKSRRANNERSVAGAIQMFRRECYEQIGGLTPIQVGGEDWIAETMARIHGWEVRAYPECRVFHHKSSSKTRGLWREKFRLGLMDYALGSHPLFEVMKCARRFRESPLLLGAICRFCGLIWGYFKQEKRPVSDDFVKYLREEQLTRLKCLIAPMSGKFHDNGNY